MCISYIFLFTLSNICSCVPDIQIITSIHYSLSNLQNNKLFENFALKRETNSSDWTVKYFTGEPYELSLCILFIVYTFLVPLHWILQCSFKYIY